MWGIKHWLRQGCDAQLLLCCIIFYAAVPLRTSNTSRTRHSLLGKKGLSSTITTSSTTTESTTVATTTPTAPPPMLVQVYTNATRRLRTTPDLTTLPIIYVVTPTYKRPQQLAELTRLSQTLRHVPAIHWIVVEDSFVPMPNVQRALRRSKLNYTHMLAPKPKPPENPPKYPNSNENIPEPRGVSCRNAALRWLRDNIQSGVLYFADDDNTYDLQIFQEMRWTKKVSVWPVALIGFLGMSSPVVENEKVVGFYDSWPGGRRFAMDMAGFAINISFLHQHPHVTMPYATGLEEDGFLSALDLTLDDLEPRASNCTEVLVWHTTSRRTVYPELLSSKETDKFEESNLLTLLDNFVYQ